MRVWLKTVILTLATATAGQAGGALRYTITPLGPANDQPARYDINETGQIIAGRFIYDYSGTVLAHVPGNPKGINDAGDVVGWAIVLNGIANGAFLYDGQQVREIWPLISPWSWAWDINNRGQIVGKFGKVTDSPKYAFLLDGTNCIDLSVSLPPGDSTGVAINNAGYVAVSHRIPELGTYRGFRYDSAAATMTDLGTLGGESSRVEDINELGQLVGSSTTAAGLGHAFLWQDGRMIDLGTLGGDRSGAVAINDLGVIVGRSQTSAGQWHMFLHDGTTMLDLNELLVNDQGWSTLIPFAINNAGLIVGQGILEGESDMHTFLLTPTDIIPEPSVWTLVLSASVMAIVWGWRRRRS